MPLTILHRGDAPDGKRVFSSKTARQVKNMLELAVSDDGTGSRARIAMYRVAGKTGTSRKAEGKGYSKEYNALFAGMAPASDPRLAMVVIVNEPNGDSYYGGTVAAPVFASVMSGALRLFDVAPDDIPAEKLLVAAREQAGSRELAR
jgi:cell division protein FtsI (penicillin-binding protein 3)